MLRTEDDPRHQVTECDIRRTRYCPATHEFWRVQHEHESDIKTRWTCHPADGCDEWHCRTAGRMQRASGTDRLNHFLCGKREEQRHTDIVDDEMQGMRKMLVGGSGKIRPHERQH